MKRSHSDSTDACYFESERSKLPVRWRMTQGLEIPAIVTLCTLVVPMKPRGSRGVRFGDNPTEIVQHGYDREEINGLWYSPRDYKP
eukprot:scaffold5092_cov179-Amphora_coffeaeformis.AAC.17